MRNNPSTPKSNLAMLYLLILGTALSCGTTIWAQSGRRLPNSKPVSAPAEAPSPTPAKPAEKPKPAYTMLVGMERDSGYMNAPLQYYTSALYSFADRLEESPSVRVQATHRDMSRSDAVRNAKAEKEAYVVWLQLRTDSLDADRSLAAAGEVFIEYSLYEPSTAKLLSSGRAYQRATRRGGVIVGPSGGTSVMQGEYMVKLAARDAAEKVLSALHLPSQRKTLP